MADQEQLRLRMRMEEEEAAAAGEPGHAGVDQYDPKTKPMTAGGANLPPARMPGTPLDAARTWANRAAVGAGPQIAGAMGALANSATQGFQDKPTSDLDAYRSVRDDTAKDLANAEDTSMGQAAELPGMMMTPLPIKALPKGATLGMRAERGAQIGGGLGGLHGAATSKGDLTRMDSEGWRKVISDALSGAAGGAAGGAVFGAASRVPAKVGENSSQTAKSLALGHLGLTPKQRGDFAASGQTQKIADALLGDGLDAIPVMGWSKGGTAERTAKRLGDIGSELGGIKSGIDKASGGTTVQPSVLADDLAEAARKHGGGVATPAEAGTPEAEAVMRDLLARAERARSFKGGKAMPLSDAEAIFKTPLNDAARKAKLATMEPPAAATARMLARDTAAASNERAAEATANALAPELASKYGPAKQKYSTIKELARALQQSEPEAFAKSGLEPAELPNVEFSGGGGSEGLSGGFRALGGKALKSVAAPAAARGLHWSGKQLQSTPTGGGAAGGLAPYLEMLAEEERKP